MTGAVGAEETACPTTVPVPDCRPLYRALAASVSVITAAGETGPVGMTASSVTAVSLTPPLLTVTLAPGSATLAAIERTRQFAVNLLGEDHQAVADRFAGRRPGWARFAGVARRDDDLPLLTDAIAAAVCDLEWLRGCGDRVLVLGRVARCEVRAGVPLLWHASAYHGLHPTSAGVGRG